MSQGSQHLLQFGPFRLDPRERVLLREGHPVPLTPKAFETLVALIENHGHLMDKDELLKRVWPDTFVEEATVAKNVSTLRQVLGDTGDVSQFIETVPKRGYRFIAEVQRIDVTPDAPAPARETAGQVAASRTAWRAGFVVLLAALVLVSWWGWREWAAPPQKLPAKRIALAVLPFSNLTDEATDDYLSDGLTEDMISRLGRLAPERLAVIARTTSMQYKQTTKNAAEIGRELNVDYVVEGSVRQEGERVRINAQLIETRNQTHVWAENYDRDLKQVLPLQREVTEAIAGQIQLWLAPVDRVGARRAEAERIVEPEAHEYYLKGRHFWNKRSPEGIRKSIEYFQKAIEIEPAYARAWAAMADSYALQNEYGGIPSEEPFLRARAAAARALEIDPGIAEAYTTQALVRAVFDWDWAGAEPDFRRAIALNPNYPTARHWFAYGPLFATGRLAEAREQLEEARKLDPFSTSISAAIGQTFYLERNYGSALEWFQKALGLTPKPNFGVYFHIALAYSQQGKHAEAIEAVREGMRLSPSADGGEHLAYMLARAGRSEEARKSLAMIEKQFAVHHASPYIFAAALAALGEKEKAVEWLERSRKERTTRLAQLALEPMFDPLRTDPRFATLVRQIGLRAANPAQASGDRP